MPERWLPVVGFEELYEVSDQGRVRSKDRITRYRDGRTRFYSGRELEGWFSKGAVCVVLSVNGRYHTRHVHKLVLEAFVGSAEAKAGGLHWDGNPRNNALHNLRWGTQTENMADAIRHKTIQHGARHYQAKIDDDLVREIRATAGLVTQQEWAKRLGMHQVTISEIRTRKTWKHVT